MMGHVGAKPRRQTMRGDGYLFQAHPSSCLSITEEVFLEAAEYDNIPEVRRMLEELPHLNINYVNYMGKIWEECKDIWSQDTKEYITEPWNLLDFSILAIFMTSFIARLMAFWHAHSAQCYIDTHPSNITLPSEVQYFQLVGMTF
ncbi:short transient receptor potential channel 6-like [Girardinichthys multiradiatus]|uniref:short transient receptor potential channel 6-like n=1 Tax=Girardinichthys multiradiatus TaxID=208333 RepID=UPI001FAE3C88|nr:short transient receptor potential channel 6-like [Girardinichthys multiradiatus]